MNKNLVDLTNESEGDYRNGSRSSHKAALTSGGIAAAAVASSGSTEGEKHVTSECSSPNNRKKRKTEIPRRLPEGDQHIDAGDDESEEGQECNEARSIGHDPDMNTLNVESIESRKCAGDELGSTSRFRDRAGKAAAAAPPPPPPTNGLLTRSRRQTGRAAAGAKPSLSHTLFVNKNNDNEPISHGPSNMHVDDAVLQDPFFQSDLYLSAMEMELLWLGEESMFAMDKDEFQFDFIYDNGSAALRVELRKLDRYSSEESKINAIIRCKDRLVRLRFEQLRQSLRMALDSGYRRPSIRNEIARLRVENKINNPPTSSIPDIVIMNEKDQALSDNNKAAAIPYSEKSQTKTLDKTVVEGGESIVTQTHQDTEASSGNILIEQIDPHTMKVIRIHKNEFMAAERTGLTPLHILTAVSKKPHMAGGFLWRHLTTGDLQTSDREASPNGPPPATLFDFRRV
ncbi:hypothetical protein ACA910_003140 [Epithemia clementina (nom. ined.)]